MSVECLFSITPRSYRRAKEEEETRGGGGGDSTLVEFCSQ